jgi:hypothetical protein
MSSAESMVRLTTAFTRRRAPSGHSQLQRECSARAAGDAER